MVLNEGTTGMVRKVEKGKLPKPPQEKVNNVQSLNFIHI
jgi:hypothetical protein